MEVHRLAEHSRKKRFVEPIDEAMIMERVAGLKGFDRAMLRFGRVLATTGGVTLKSPAKGKVMTCVEIAHTYLKRIGASTFETGKSTLQIAKATGYQRITMSNALNKLVNRGILKSEKRGRHIRYFLPSPP